MLSQTVQFLVCKLGLNKPKIWRRKWQPIAVFLPGKSHGQRSLGNPMDDPTVHGVAKKSDMTQRLNNTQKEISLTIYLISILGAKYPFNQFD